MITFPDTGRIVAEPAHREIREVTVLRRPRPKRVHPAYGRPYWSTTHRSYQSRPKVYFDVVDETVGEHLVNRHRRPGGAWRALLPAALGAVGIPAAISARWDIHAGCSMCPCSPGFRLGIDWSEVADAPFDVWVTVGADLAFDPEVPEPQITVVI